MSRNIPLRIEEYPLPERTPIYVRVKSPEKVYIEPVIFKRPDLMAKVAEARTDRLRTARDDKFLGLSVAVEQALLRLGIPHYAWGVGILRDHNLTGKRIQRSDIVKVLRQYVSKDIARKAYDALAFKAPNSNVTGAKSTAEYQEFVEFVSKIPFYSLNTIQGNFDTNSISFSKKPQKGRKATESAYIPAEADLEQALFAVGEVTRGDPDLGKYIWKFYSEISSSTEYKQFVLTYHVELNGKRKYSRKEIADRVGYCEKSVRKNSELAGQKVEMNPIEKKLLSNAEIDILPLTDEISAREVEAGRLFGGLHLQDFTGKRYAYSQEGAKRIRENGNTKVYACAYPPSTYTPAGDREVVVERRNPNWVDRRKLFRFGQSIRRPKNIMDLSVALPATQPFVLDKHIDIVGYSHGIRSSVG